MKKKILFMLVFVFGLMIHLKGVYAASASISANKTSVTVGTKVTVTVKINAAAWNVVVGGDVSDSIVGANLDAENQTTTKTYTITPKKAGTYTVYLSGDITDQNSDNSTAVNKSVTITAKEKPATNNTNTTTNNNKTTTNKTQNTTTTKKSSNANISKLTLSVEGLSFNTNQTTYNIKVGEDVDKISVGVTLAHSKAVYSISGNKNLKAGNNVIKIVVTAEDGTTKTYKINVNKEGNIEDTSSELSNLIIEDMSFQTAFSPTDTEYIGSKIKYTESLNILPFTVAEKATVEIIGNENLKAGDNTVIIKVTSYDKSSTTEYKVNFEMLSKEETNALQVVNPYVDSKPKMEQENRFSDLQEVLMENSTIILLYMLALVEFGQVIYLYVQLKNADPSAVTITTKKRKSKDNNN